MEQHRIARIAVQQQRGKLHTGVQQNQLQQEQKLLERTWHMRQVEDMAPSAAAVAAVDVHQVQKLLQQLKKWAKGDRQLMKRYLHLHTSGRRLSWQPGSLFVHPVLLQLWPTRKTLTCRGWGTKHQWRPTSSTMSNSQLQTRQTKLIVKNKFEISEKYSKITLPSCWLEEKIVELWCSGVENVVCVLNVSFTGFLYTHKSPLATRLNYLIKVTYCLQFLDVEGRGRQRPSLLFIVIG